MKKFALLGVAALLFALPLAACGGEGSALLRDAADGGRAAEELFPAVSQLPAPSEPETSAPTRAEYILTETDGLNVRAGAGVSCAVLGAVQKGVLLHLDGREGNWYRTCYRGETAYVSANEKYASVAALDAGDERTERVVREGLRLLGVPYVYGATRLHDGTGTLLRGFSAERFDCSSLMQYIFYRGAGVLLDVTTRTQIKQGEHVEWSDLRRGDLLFFTNAARQNKTGLERVGHVALYLGENYILHTASDYAKAEQISATRRGYFLEARRVL